LINSRQLSPNTSQKRTGKAQYKKGDLKEGLAEKRQKTSKKKIMSLSTSSRNMETG
jgi:hypothetical protein